MRNIFLTIKDAIKESGIFPSYRVREKLAALYLRGEGLEIGALHLPLKVPRNVKVRYVDIAAREENIRRFPELDSSRIVDTDYLENGFEIGSIADASQDFVIANHVLEHADNPLKVLMNWGRVLKQQGILMVTVPIAARCFDRGRPETSLEHLIGDYRLNEAGEKGIFLQKNREHYEEWLRTAAPVVARMRGVKLQGPEQHGRGGRLEEVSESENADIHFHTFSRASYARFVECFAAEIAGDFRVMEIRGSRGGAEVVAILRKL